MAALSPIATGIVGLVAPVALEVAESLLRLEIGWDWRNNRKMCPQIDSFRPSESSAEFWNDAGRN
jgi:hypothetical protein